MFLLVVPIVFFFLRIFFHVSTNLIYKVLATGDHIRTRMNYNETTRNPKSLQRDQDEKQTLHFCFFVNGFLADSLMRCYLFETVSNSIFVEKPTAASKSIILHFITSNNGKTFDGVENGGKRVANEILEVINKEVNQLKGTGGNEGMITDITISIFGLSLGGLYGRYAVGELYRILSVKSDKDEDDKCSNDCMVVENGIRVHFNTFCTVATPHLSESKQTYVLITRYLETILSKLIKQTGRDLFNFNNVLWDMSTSKKFLEPLGLFQKRIAYSNAFHTDFMVSTDNGAFLNPYSKYPHQLMEDTEQLLKSCEGLVVATVMTEKTTIPMLPSNIERDEEELDLLYMSVCLDSLGWKKVFIDNRRESPGVLDSSFGKKETQIDVMLSVLNNLKTRSFKSGNHTMIESRQLCGILSCRQGSLWTIIPFGHPLMTGKSINPLGAALTWGGRQTARYIADQFVEDMMSFRAVMK